MQNATYPTQTLQFGPCHPSRSPSSSRCQRHSKYSKTRTALPFVFQIPISKVDDRFEEIISLKSKPKKREPGEYLSWIQEKTWTLIDQRANTKSGPLKSLLNKQIRRRLKIDRKRRARLVGEEIERLIKENKVQEAWIRFRRCYHQASGKPPKPTQEDISFVTTEFHSLYTAPVSQTDENIPVITEEFPIPDGIPSEEELMRAVDRLKGNRSAGPSGLKAEDLKKWKTEYMEAIVLLEEEEDEATWQRMIVEIDTLPWTRLVDLVEDIFLSGQIPQKLSWATLVLIPKPDGRFRGIGLLETVWKIVSSIINARLSNNITFHSAIHGFRAERGTGTAILEAKLLVSLSAKEGRTLYQVFLDLSKAYDSISRERMLEILQGYGVGPRILRILQNFWESQLIAVKQQKNFVQPFRPTRGVTQGDIVSPTIFNVIVDAVVWVLAQEVKDTERGQGKVKTSSIFYADDGYIASFNPQGVQ